MDKDRFIKWFLAESDDRFSDDLVIELTLKTVTNLNFSQNGSIVTYEYWAHDPTTISTDSALISVPYAHISDSCSEISFPKRIGLYKWTDRFDWETSGEFEDLNSNYERTTDALNVTLYEWSDPVIPNDVFDNLFESFPEDYSWRLGEYLIKNHIPLDKFLKYLPAQVVTFLQACIKEHVSN